MLALLRMTDSIRDRFGAIIREQSLRSEKLNREETSCGICAGSPQLYILAMYIRAALVHCGRRACLVVEIARISRLDSGNSFRTRHLFAFRCDSLKRC